MTSSPPLASRPVSRRWLLRSAPVAALVLAGCGTAATSTTSTSTTATTTAAAGSTTAAAPATTGSVAALAQAFLATLDADQTTATLLDYGLANAARWSNLPQALLSGGGGSGGGPGGGGGSSQSRVGTSIGGLSTDQLAALTALLQAATGTTTGLGYDEIVQHLNADDYLQANGGGDDYGRAQFFVALLGSPADTGTWELQLGGHHLAVANTYVDGTLAGATPAFRGIEPNAAFDEGGRTNQPMAVKEAAFAALLASLSSDQQSAALLPDVYTDLVLGPGKDWVFPTTAAGVQVSTLSADQKALVLAAVATYVDDLPAADAARILAGYESELDDTHLAYSGSTTLTEQDDYVRVDGPSVWIEFSMQHGIVLSGNHPHSVWRDRSTDYAGTRS